MSGPGLAIVISAWSVLLIAVSNRRRFTAWVILRVSANQGRHGRFHPRLRAAWRHQVHAAGRAGNRARARHYHRLQAPERAQVRRYHLAAAA